MRFRVLGPLEVWDGTQWRGLGAPKWRSLLAALLIRSGRVSSVSDLVDELWGDEPPSGAVNLVHGYVARLRGALNDSDGHQLSSRSPGYALRVGPADMDTQRFEALAAEGFAAQERGEPRAAVRLYAESLELWRGPAYADVPPTLLTQAEADRLAERRLTVLEARIDAEMALGHHAGWVAELQALVGEHPLREPLWRLLMLALYRSHRQAEALETFQRLCKTLDSELGVPPGRSLRELQQQILANDSALELDLEAASHGTAPTLVAPRQLPLGTADFIGRETEVRRLDSALDAAAGAAAAASVIVVSGAGGVGKTTLAVHWAHRIVGRFPDGQLYLDLQGYGRRSTRTTDAALGRLLRALDVAPERIPSDLDEAVALYRSLLSDRRILVVLDNARTVEQVRPLLPGGRSSLVVVTSRDRLTGLVAAEGAQVVALERLTPVEARQFLVARLGADRILDESKAVDTIITACARLPLALALAAARATVAPTSPLATLAGELAETEERLDALDAGDPTTDVRAVLSWSYQGVGEPAQRMFRLLGLHPGPDLSAGAAASLAGIGVAQAGELLQELAGAHLAIEGPGTRYGQHDLLRAYATELIDAEETRTDRSAAVRRLVDHYLHSAHAANRLRYPHRNAIALSDPVPDVEPDQFADVDAAAAWLATEHQLLIAAVGLAATNGLHTQAWQLAWELGEYLDRAGLWRDWATVQEIALTSAKASDDLAGQAHSHRNLAGALFRLECWDEAPEHLELASELFESLDDRAGQADAEYGLILVCAQREHYAAALTHAERALELYRGTDQTMRYARALNAVGWAHALLGNHTQTLDHCRQALSLLQELGDRFGEASTWDTLGQAHHHLGDNDEAIRCHQRALELYEGSGTKYHQAEILVHLGQAHKAAGASALARDVWVRALGILEELQHPETAQLRAELASLPDG
jgi:DNA-binding SARP family transcriptional activator/tetratricopeptide (TPR) repeat protein